MQKNKNKNGSTNMEYFRVELLIVCIIAFIQFAETVEIVRETENFTGTQNSFFCLLIYCIL